MSNDSNAYWIRVLDRSFYYSREAVTNSVFYNFMNYVRVG